MTYADLPAPPAPFAPLTTATVRRVTVALQCAVTIAVGWAAHDWAGWHWPAVMLPAGAALILGYLISVGRVSLVSLKGLGTAIPDDPMWGRMSVPRKQRAGITGFIACQLRECVSVVWMFNVLQPFRARIAFDASTDAGRRVPVLMVHGYGCSHAVWLPIRQHPAAAGHPTDTVDFMPLLSNTDEYAQDIATVIAQLTRAHGRVPILLRHSMSGLAARVLLQQAEPSPMTYVITLGIPHRGTVMTHTGRGRNVRQMVWTSPWLRQFAASETLAVRARIISTFSWHDPIVGPLGASWLGGAQHVPFTGIGYVSLLRDAHVRDAVLAELVRTKGVAATASA